MPFEKGRRSSILKPPKARNPLSNLNLNANDGDDDGTTQCNERNKRVSFSNTQGIAIFRKSEHGNTIWDNFIEETNKVNCSETTDTDIKIPDEDVDKSEQLDDLDNIKEQLLHDNSDSFDKLIDISFTPSGNHDATFAVHNDDDNDDEDICVNISNFNSCQKPTRRITDIMLELTNPSVTDQTEALINYKIPHNLSSCANAIEGKVDDVNDKINKSVDVVSATNNSASSISKPKSSFVHSFVYTDKNIQNWHEEKENRISLHINDTLESEPENKNKSINDICIENDEDVHDRTLVCENDTKYKSNCNMSMTKMVPSTLEYQDADGLIMNIKKSNQSCLDDTSKSFVAKNRRQTLLFNNQDPGCDMSMCTAISSTMICKDKDLDTTMNNTRDHKRKRQTILFDPNNTDCDMSMTKIIPTYHDDGSSITNKRKSNINALINPHFTNNQSNKRQTLSVNECKSIVSRGILKTEIDSEENTGQTIIFDRENIDCDLSMTMAVPSSVSVNKGDHTRSDMDKENHKDQTIAFVDCDMSQTMAVPSDISQKMDTSEDPLPIEANCRRQTNLFKPKDREESFAADIPNPELQKSDNNFDLETSNYYPRRQTIAFVDCEMPQTMVVPLDISQKMDTSSDPLPIETNCRRQTIVFNQKNTDCEMSMTSALPSLKSQCNDNVRSNHETEREESNNGFIKKDIINKHNNISLDFEEYLKETIEEKPNRQTIAFDHKRPDYEMPSRINTSLESKVVLNKSDMKNVVCEMSLPISAPSSNVHINSLNEDLIIKSNSIAIEQKKTDSEIYEPTNINVGIDQKKSDDEITINTSDISMSDFHNISLDVEKLLKNPRRKSIVNKPAPDREIQSILTIPSSHSEIENRENSKIMLKNYAMPLAESITSSDSPNKGVNFILHNNDLLSIESNEENCDMENIIFRQETPDCPMPIIKNILPHVAKHDVSFGIDSLLAELNKEDCNKESIVFEQKHDDSKISTEDEIQHKVEPLSSDCTTSSEPNKDNCRRQTIIFDKKNEDCEMSMTTIIPSSGSPAICNIDSGSNRDVCRRQTIVFDQKHPDFEMSMTVAIPSSISHDGKERFSLFDQVNLKCDTISDSEVHDKDVSLTIDPLPIENDKENRRRQTIVFDQKHGECEMSMTTAIPSSNYECMDVDKSLNIDIISEKLNSEDDSQTELNDRRGQTIVFDQKHLQSEMSMTIAVPQSGNINFESKTDKEIVISDQKNSEMSITTSFSPFKENSAFLDTENLLKELKCKRQTIVFDQNHLQSEMSMTIAVPPSGNISFDSKTDKGTVFSDQKNTESSIAAVISSSFSPSEENGTISNSETLLRDLNRKRQTIVFDQNHLQSEMSMTIAVPQSVNISFDSETDKETVFSDQKNTESSFGVVIPSSFSLSKENTTISNAEIPLKETNRIRQTIVFDPKHLQSEMSMTIVVPSSDIQESNISLDSKTAKETVISDQNYSESSISPSKENAIISEAEILLKESNRKTIVFDQNHLQSEMSMTIVVPPSDKKENNTSFDSKTVKETLISDQKNSESSSFSPSKENNTISKAETPLKESNCKRQTMVFDQKLLQSEISTTIVVPSSDIQESNLSFDSKTVKETIIDQKNSELSITTVIPSSFSPSKENDIISKAETPLKESNNKRQTIVFDQKHVDSDTSMIKVVLPLDSEMENVSEEVNKSIMPPSIENSAVADVESPSKKNIVFDEKHFDSEMSMTKLVPSADMQHLSVTSSIVENRTIADSEMLSLESNEENHRRQSIVVDQNISTPIANIIPSSELSIYLNDKNMVLSEFKHIAESIDEKLTTADLSETSNDKIVIVEDHNRNRGDENNIKITDSVSFEIDQCEAMDVDEDYSFGKPPTVTPVTDTIAASSANDISECDETLELLRKSLICGKASEQTIPSLRNSAILKMKDDSIITSSNKSSAGVISQNSSKIDPSDSAKKMNVSVDPIQPVEIQDISVKSDKNELSIRSDTSDKRKYSSLDADGESNNDSVPVKRKKSLTSVLSWLNEIRQSTESPDVDHETSDSVSANISERIVSGKDAMLENISDVSLVDTTMEMTDDASNSSELQNDASLIEEIKIETIDIDDVFESLNFDQSDCVMEDKSDGIWTFLLLNNTIRLQIRFENCLEKSTNISNISIERIYDADLKSLECLMCKAMMNQWENESIATMYTTLSDISELLIHCVKICKDTQRWGRVIRFLYLQNSFEWNEEKFTYYVFNGVVKCIWQFDISLKNIPVAKLEDIEITMECGESPIPNSELTKVIENVEPSWNYMKNLIDDLYNYVNTYCDRLKECKNI